MRKRSTIWELKFCSLWAFSIVLVTGLVFAIDYNWFHGSFPGYEILAWPGITTLSFFSEEMDFFPKLATLLLSQFIGYAFAIYFFKMVWIVAAFKIKEYRI